MTKAFNALDEEFFGPKISKRQRRLYQERDMARWKAWKAKQEKNIK